MNIKRNMLIAPIVVAAFGFAATPGIAAGGAVENCEGSPGQTVKGWAQVPGESMVETWHEVGGKTPGQSVMYYCAPGQQP